MATSSPPSPNSPAERRASSGQVRGGKPGGAGAQHAEARGINSSDQLIAERIAEAQSALWRAELSRALLIPVVGTLVAVVAWAVMDQWIWSPNRAFRLIALIGGVAALVLWVVKRIVPLMSRQILPEYAAYSLEHDLPELRHSLTSYVSLREDHQREGVRGLVVRSIGVRAAGQLKSHSIEVPSEATGNLVWWLGVAGAIALLAGYAFLSPKDTLQSTKRLLLPLSSIESPTRVRITDVLPGDIEVLAERPTEISAKIDGLGKVEVARIEFGTDFAKSASMSLDPDTGRSVGNIAVESSGQYRVVAGDSVAGPYEITTRDVPALTIDAVEVTPPQYTKLPVRLTRGGAIVGEQSSIAKVSASTNRPIERARIEFNPRVVGENVQATGGVLEMQMSSDATKINASFPLRIPTAGSGAVTYESYRIRVWDAAGNENPEPIVFPIRIVADLIPEVVIVSPTAPRTEVPVNGAQSIEVRSVDPDYGLQKIEVLVKKGIDSVHSEIVWSSEEGARGSQDTAWLFQPEKLGLRVNDVVQLSAIASDNRHDEKGEPMPNVVASDSIEFLVVARDENAKLPNFDEPGKEQAEDGKRSDKPGEQGEKGGEGEKGSQGGSGGSGSGEEGESAAGESGQGGEPGQGSESGQEGEPGQQSEQGGSGANQGQQSGDASGKGQPSDSPEAGGEPGDSSPSEPGSDSNMNPGDPSQPSKAGAPSSDASKAGDGGAGENAQGEAGDTQGKPAGDAQGKPGDTQGESTGEAGQDGSSAGQPGKPQHDGDAFERIRDFINEKNQQGKPDQGSRHPNDKPGQPNQDAAQQAQEGSGNEDVGNEGSPGDAKPKGADQASKDSAAKEPAANGGESAQGNDRGNSNNQDGANDESGQGKPASGDEEMKSPAPENGQPSSEQKGAPESGAGEQSMQGEAGGEQAGEPGASEAGKGEGQSEEPSAQDSAPDESKPGEAKPGDGKPGDGKPGDGKPGDGKPGDGNPGDGKPGDGKPGDGKPGDGKPGESKPGESKPGESKPGESKPGESGAGTPDADGQPTAGQPSGESKPDDASSQGQSSGGAPNGEVGEGGEGTLEQVAPPPDPVDVEYARRATDMVLDYLESQKETPSPELLERLDWTPEELRAFTDRWNRLRKDGGPNAGDQKQVEEALRSLGIRAKPEGAIGRSGDADDSLRGLKDAGNRTPPPPVFRDAFDAFRRNANRPRN